jgi:hypothetical protein
VAQDAPPDPKLVRSDAAVLDLTRNAADIRMESSVHTPLPEEYIWTASNEEIGTKVSYVRSGINEKTEHHYFRREFVLDTAPEKATLYIAGPRWARTYINGRLVDDVSSDLSSLLVMHVFTTAVEGYLKAGKNIIAIEAVRGRGGMGFGNSAIVKQKTLGQVVVVKLLPAAPGVDAKTLLISDKSWKSATEKVDGWQKTGFIDAGWKPVQSIGGIEGDIEMFQWNADAGLYDWPGYDGISAFLAHTRIPVSRILEQFSGRNRFVNLEALTGSSGEFGVSVRGLKGSEDAPSLLLDFGRELTGRLEIESDSDTPAVISIQYGESVSETLNEPYLGVNLLTIAPHTTGHGPKTAFRYAKLRFVNGGPDLKFKSIHVDDIFYPVRYEGSFESSDKELNRIWETGAYTAHLCMQDGLWDAPKRDRGRWAGDNDVSQRVINNVFADHFLLEDTMEHLIGEAPVKQMVNGIPGYSSFWITSLAEYYRHSGSIDFIKKMHERTLQLMHLIDANFDERSVYANKSKTWLYVDWSPELNGDTAESRRATEFEFYRAYREGAWLLREAGDAKNADFFEKRAEEIQQAADKYLLDPSTGSYGPRWQTNAMAVLSGVAGPERYEGIWKNVLSKVGHTRYNGLIISPYYNYYVIAAMAKMGHQKDALEWIRTYWGGMLAEGATSFWEGYDPDWYKENFHAALQSDNQSGYRISLAHGWASGPTAWLMEEMLGIRVTGAGFRTVDIRPELMGLEWAKGAEPTPNGLLKVEARKSVTLAITVDIPEGVEAHVSVPVTHAGADVMVDGKLQKGVLSEAGTRSIITLQQAGRYQLEGK